MRVTLLNKIKIVPKHLWFLLVIICLGIFLRTYNFHGWLHFEADQFRDATLVNDVLTGKVDWPLLGPSMRKSSESKDALFHVGPIYYYFQILSAKLFGNNPVSMAYPDLFFSILTIPLLYVFLRRYFSVNTALVLIGLYAISFFSIRYSRFAWNPNPIPFFTILLLLSLLEFLTHKEKTHWAWVVATGIAVGVGIQLHVMLLILFPVITFLVFLYILKYERGIWKKIIAVFAIAVVLNAGYLISEFKNNFSNSKILFKSERVDGDKIFLGKFIDDVDCHMEANLYMLSSYGSENCNFSYSNLLKDKKAKTLVAKIKSVDFIASTFLQGLFSIFGYTFLLCMAWKEKDKQKKYFLALISIFVALFFMLMFLVIGESFDSFRYFSPTFFVPLLFVGFLFDFIKRKLSKGYFIVVIIFILAAIVIANINSIKYEVQKLQAGVKSDILYHNAILGEFDLIIRYFGENYENQRDIYVSGERDSVFPTLEYLAQRKSLNVLNFDYRNKDVLHGKVAFYIGNGLKDDNFFANYKIADHRIFGRIIVYKLDN